MSYGLALFNTRHCFADIVLDDVNQIVWLLNEKTIKNF